MIFVTVGNHYQGFDRLIKKVDEIAPRIPAEMVIQTGYSAYRPQNVKFFDFVPIQAAMDCLKGAELVISHAGIGTIILCRENGIPLILFPRRKKLREHGTDHQMEIAAALEERKEPNVYIVYEEERLEEKVVEVLAKKEKLSPAGNVGKANLIKTLKEFLKKGT